MKNHPDCIAIVTSDDIPIVQRFKESVIEKNQKPEARQSFSKFTEFDSAHLVHNILASDKVMYKGHPIAAVAARNQHKAEELLNLIKVEYEVLNPVTSIESAIRNNATKLTEIELERNIIDNSISPETIVDWANVGGDIYNELGDLQQGISESDYIIEKDFTTETVHQGYIEPHAATAMWAPDGRLTIWTCTQGSFAIRSATAAIAGIPESQVKVIPTEIGGGFGAKLTTYLEPVAAMLSRKSGRPVKIVMTRKEVFEGTGPTSAAHMKVKIGSTNSGKITAAKVYLAYEAGAYPGSPVGGGTLCATGPYNIENLLVDGLDIVCNKQKVQAYRAPGQPQAAFAVEPVIDELAEKLGLDPLEFRLKNAVTEGDRMPNGVPHRRFGCKELIEAMKDHPHYQTPLEGDNRGRGVALGFRWQGGQTSSCTINVNKDGTINLITGSVDIGGTRTSVAMQAAEILGIKVEDVSPSVVDTDTVGFTASTGGSRITFDTGLAAVKAAEEILKEMCSRAALIWEVQTDDVTCDDGIFVCAKNSEDKLTFKELASQMIITGGPVTCSVSANSTGIGPIIAGNIVDVEVDPETGKVDILRYTAFLDAGKAIHPSYVEGQIQGGTVQGIGWALNEEYFYTEDGTMANSSFLDYRMPTTLDVPMIEPVIVEVPNPRHPFGVRGVGEAPIIPPLPALANAIYDAVGIRMECLPMSPSAILEALEKKTR